MKDHMKELDDVTNNIILKFLLIELGLNQDIAFIEDNKITKGTIVGYHSILKMFKIKSESGKEYLKDPNDLANI